MSEQPTNHGDIDAVIERIRAEAAAEEARQGGAFIASYSPAASGSEQTGGSNGRIRRGLARRFGWLRYRLRSTVLRPLRRLGRSPIRPATNRAMLQTVNRIEQLEQQIEEYQDRFESGLQEQSELLADTKADSDDTREKLPTAMDAFRSDLEAVRSELRSRLKSTDELLEAAKSELNSRLASMGELLEAVSRRLDRVDEGHMTFDARFDHQASEMAVLREDISRVRMEAQLRLYHLDNLAARLESRDGRLSRDSAGRPAGTDSPAASEGALDAFYLAFENACRGDEADIAAQLRADYLETVQAALARTGEGGVLDIGCGRGEWLRVLGEAGIEASGIDLSPVMAEHCRGQGLDVVAGDAVHGLAERSAESLTVISGFHIIEHLPFAVLYRLFEEVARVLRADGLFIFETPNPENVLVGSHTFYHDATHSNPLTPTAMRFLAEHHGFHPVEIRRLHPYPPEARVSGSDPLTERVNGHLCGPQDYALIGQKPRA